MKKWLKIILIVGVIFISLIMLLGILLFFLIFNELNIPTDAGILRDQIPCSSGSFIEVDNKLAYSVEGGLTEKSYVVYDGVKGKKYDGIYSLIEVNDKLVYGAKEGDSIFMVYDGMELREFTKVGFEPVEVNNKLAYFVSNDNGKRSVVYDGVKGKEYDRVDYLVEVNNKLAYIAHEGDKEFFVYDGNETGKEYEGVWGITEVNGKIAYIAEEGNMSFVVYGGVEGKRYDSVTELVDVNGKLSYIARIKEETGKPLPYPEYKYYKFVVYDGVEGKRYDSITFLFEFGGNLVYVALEENKVYTETEETYMINNETHTARGLKITNNQKEFFVIDGVEQQRYDRINDIVDVNGKLAYIIGKIEKYDDFYKDQAVETGYYVIFDGKESKRYDRITDLFNVNGKLTYKVWEGNKQFIVFDGKEVGKKYDKVSFDVAYVYDDNERERTESGLFNTGPKLLEIQNNLAFVALDDVGYLVSYGNREIIKGYRKHELIEVNDKLVVFAEYFSATETSTCFLFSED